MSEVQVLGLFNHRARPWLAESVKNADIDEFISQKLSWRYLLVWHPLDERKRRYFKPFWGVKTEN
jgi:hypothetical protein